MPDLGLQKQAEQAARDRNASTLRFGDDDLLLGDEALDAADEERAVGVQGFGFGRGVGAVHRGAVVVPGLGDAIDRDLGRRDVGPGALID